MFWTVIENQKTAGGSFGLIYNHYESESQALAKFFTICASASQSDIPYHSAHMLASDGSMVRQEIFDRREEVSTEEE